VEGKKEKIWREREGKERGRRGTERGDYILSEKIPNQNRKCQYFGFFLLEPKEKNPFRRTPYYDLNVAFNHSDPGN
jgi:hypothetical protein